MQWTLEVSPQSSLWTRGPPYVQLLLDSRATEFILVALFQGCDSKWLIARIFQNKENTLKRDTNGGIMKGYKH